MKSVRIQMHHAVLTAVVFAAAIACSPSPAGAQKAQSRLTPIIVNPGAESLGSSLRLRNERLDLSTITREDSSMKVGRELTQGESVTRLRMQKDRITPDSERERRQEVIREQDDLRHKRITVIYDD